MNNKRSSAHQFLKNKKQILEELNNQQKDRINIRLEETPQLKLGNIRPEGISLELKVREINDNRHES